MNDKEIDVLAINEAQMDDSVPIESIAIQGYNWISKNRNRSGGGIGFFIRDSINFRKNLPKLRNSNLLQDCINMNN